MAGLVRRLMGMMLILQGASLSGAPALEANEVVLRFPQVSTILNKDETQKIQALVKRQPREDVCYSVRGYFSMHESYPTYRIIGRARVLETYRLLVLAGVSPKKINISSLGVLTEDREYREYPLGSLVYATAHASSSLACPSPKSFHADGSVQDAQKNELILDYDILDADPTRLSFDQFRTQIQVHKDLKTKMNITAYADHPGSHYLNMVLSRLRALVLFRTATLGGYEPELISLQWKGRVTPRDKNVPAAIAQMPRRTIVQFETKDDHPPAISSTKNQDESTTDRTASLSKESTSHASWQNWAKDWSIGIFGGMTTPPSSLSNDVKTTTIYGLALRKRLSSWDGILAEGSYSSQTHSITKNSDVSGNIKIQTLRLGLADEVASWVGGTVVVHGGALMHRWTGSTSYKPNDEAHADSGSDLGLYLATSNRYEFFNQMYIAPILEIDGARSSLKGWMSFVALELGWRF